jgi:hypothetical protein
MQRYLQYENNPKRYQNVKDPVLVHALLAFGNTFPSPPSFGRLATLLRLLCGGNGGGPMFPVSYPTALSSPSLRLSAVLRLLNLLLCHGNASFGVPGLDPEDPNRVGARAACAVPGCAFDVFLRRESERVVVVAVEPAVLVLHLRSRVDAIDSESSWSGFGVTLRDELRECEASRPRRALGLRLRSLMLPVTLPV